MEFKIRLNTDVYYREHCDSFSSRHRLALCFEKKRQMKLLANILAKINQKLQHFERHCRQFAIF